ncbi:MAG: tyrosine-type recombinase/integrase [Candidatus Nanopelagicales bacterium]
MNPGTGGQPRTDEHGRLVTKVVLPGYPITIHPPTVAYPYHRIVYTIEGQRKTTSGGVTADAAMAKAEQLADILDAEATRANQPFTVLLDEWLAPDRARARPWSLKTHEHNEWVAAKHVKPIIGNVQCVSLRREHMLRAVNHAPTPGEGRRVRTLLGTVIRYGYAHGYLTIPPDRLLLDVHWSRPGHRLPAHATEQGTDDTLWVPPEAIPSSNDVAFLAAAFLMLQPEGAPYWWGLTPMFAAYTGLRIGELVGLKASDINTATRTVRVERQIVEVKGRKHVTLPKGNKRRTTIYPRTVPGGQWWDNGYPLADLVALRVREVMAENPDGLMFPSKDGVWWTRSNFYDRRFHPAAAMAGWPTKPTTKRNGQPGERLTWPWHHLRHVFCTHYLWTLGAAPADVSNAAGHADVNITLRIYASQTTGSMERLTNLG